MKERLSMKKTPPASKSQLQFQNFEAALNQLKLFTSTPVEDDRDRAGIIQAFEFTFEQCWKFFQKKAEEFSEEAPGPKPALEIALRYRWIKSKDELNWLNMLKDRNFTSHTYQQELSNMIFDRIMKVYLNLLDQVLLDNH